MIKITIRIFEALHAALVKSAKKNHRSLNGEILHGLLEYLRSEGYKVEEPE